MWSYLSSSSVSFFFFWNEISNTFLSLETLILYIFFSWTTRECNVYIFYGRVGLKFFVFTFFREKRRDEEEWEWVRSLAKWVRWLFLLFHLTLSISQLLIFIVIAAILIIVMYAVYPLEFLVVSHLLVFKPLWLFMTAQR